MIRGKRFYKKIYYISNPEIISDKQFDNLLMCETRNWDYYFHALDLQGTEGVDFEEIKDVELVEFNGREEMFDFWSKTKDTEKIGFSLEHDFPCLLKYAF